MFTRRRLVTGLIALLATTGCATIERGTRQPIEVISDPAGAAVQTEACGIENPTVIETPAVIWVSRRAGDCTIRISKEGYHTSTVRLHREFDPADGVVIHAVIDTPRAMFSTVSFWGALFLGGLAVDSATGAAFVFDPDLVFVELDPDWDAPVRDPRRDSG